MLLELSREGGVRWAGPVNVWGTGEVYTRFVGTTWGQETAWNEKHWYCPGTWTGLIWLQDLDNW